MYNEEQPIKEFYYISTIVNCLVMASEKTNFTHFYKTLEFLEMNHLCKFEVYHNFDEKGLNHTIALLFE